MLSTLSRETAPWSFYKITSDTGKVQHGERDEYVVNKDQDNQEDVESGLHH